MKTLKVLSLIGLLIIAMVGCQKFLPPAPDPGDTIAEPTEGLAPAQLASFLEGDELFAKVYSPEEGLGPVFIQASCEGCHVGDGKGSPFNMETRFGKYSQEQVERWMLLILTLE